MEIYNTRTNFVKLQKRSHKKQKHNGGFLDSLVLSQFRTSVITKYEIEFCLFCRMIQNTIHKHSDQSKWYFIILCVCVTHCIFSEIMPVVVLCVSSLLSLTFRLSGTGTVSELRVLHSKKIQILSWKFECLNQNLCLKTI